MRSHGWTRCAQTGGSPKNSRRASKATPGGVTEEPPLDTNVEDLARDQIAQLIAARFKGHALTRLVEALLIAQGYTTYRSPEGPDAGADIVAGSGPLGFGRPRLCVEVKSESSPTRPADRRQAPWRWPDQVRNGAGRGVRFGGAALQDQREESSSRRVSLRFRLWTIKGTTGSSSSIL